MNVHFKMNFHDPDAYAIPYAITYACPHELQR